MKTFKEFLNEKAPPGKKAEEWIKKNKQKFKDEYGEDWEQVLYATAWKMFGETIEEVDVQLYSLLEELSTASSTTTGGVDNPDAPPMFKKSTVFGHPCLEVDADTYHNCVQGKVPFKRWKKYVGDTSLESELKTMYHKNKKLLVKNANTGSMVYLK